MTRRRNDEAALQRAVISHLEARAHPRVTWWHTPSSSTLGGRRTQTGVPFEAIRLKRLGFKPGIPDLSFVHNGRYFGLELKTKKGRPTAAQMEFASNINASGGAATIAYDLDTALRTLETWGLLKGSSM
jgi:hypothetical protein